MGILSKTEWIIVGIVFVMLLLALIFPISETTESPASGIETTEKITAIGEDVMVGSISYKVNELTTASEIGEYIFDTFMGERANGIFYVIDLTIENKGKESENLFMPTLKIIDDQEREFDSDTGAEMYYDVGGKKAISFGEQLQPGLPITGVKMFDLPKDAKGLKLKITGSGWSADKAYVDLGR